MQEGDSIPEFWTKKPIKELREKWKQGIEDLLIYHESEIQHEKFNLAFIKRVIPCASKYDINWRGFKFDKFEPEKYKAHAAMYDTLKEQFEALQSQYESEKAADEERVKQAKAEEEKRAEEEAELLQQSIGNRREQRSCTKQSAASVDNTSNHSKTAKKIAKTASTGSSKAVKVQSAISIEPSGKIGISSSKSALEQLWDTYDMRKRELKSARKAFENYRKTHNFHKTPPSSEDEE